MDDRERLGAALGSLLRAVGRLSLEPEEQIRYLNQIGVGGLSEELALEFNDALQLGSQLAEAGQLVPAEVQILETIDAALVEMSGPDHRELWGDDALREAAEWREIRLLAASFFLASGIPVVR